MKHALIARHTEGKKCEGFSAQQCSKPVKNHPWKHDLKFGIRYVVECKRISENNEKRKFPEMKIMRREMLVKIW